jgi:hypothetical protein
LCHFCVDFPPRRLIYEQIKFLSCSGRSTLVGSCAQELS